MDIHLRYFFNKDCISECFEHVKHKKSNHERTIITI